MEDHASQPAGVSAIDDTDARSCDNDTQAQTIRFNDESSDVPELSQRGDTHSKSNSDKIRAPSPPATNQRFKRLLI
jgi:hypothetical protein